MADPVSNIAELEAKLAAVESRLNYFASYSQMDALVSAYRYYRVRNAMLEDRIAKTLKKEKRPIRVYYFVYLLDQVCYPLLAALKNNEQFELRVLANHPDQVEFLRERGYTTQLVHSKWDEFPAFSEAGKEPFNADICFSEMPYGNLPSLEKSIRTWMISGEWLPRYDDIFGRYELNNALFCMVHYAYFLAENWLWLKSDPDLNAHYGLPYPNFCWMYFLESQSHLEFALDRNTVGNTSNYVVTGYPKYDAYLSEPSPTGSFMWKFPESKNGDKGRKRIVYAPHFKRSDATLKTTCETLLTLADTGKYEIVFKPHPLYNSTVNEFAPLFNAHPSCQTVRNGDSSQYIFATADLAIISSLSMHADGLFSGKPYISELPENNFNHIGREVRAAGYSLEKGTNLGELIDGILDRGDDPLKTTRDELRKTLATPGKSASDNILQAILSRLEIR